MFRSLNQQRTAKAAAFSLAVAVALSCQVAQAEADDPPGFAHEELAELSAASKPVRNLRDSQNFFDFESSSGVRVRIPKDARQAIKIQSGAPGSSPLTITLPFSQKAKMGDPKKRGKLQFDNRNRSTSTVLPYEDGSLQVSSQ
ncbi:MAG: hypothetical protein Q4G46_04985 [Propionibacteriaceae bacterium]|nr:hypothetical protein [Propionibacteriaceae bacterium]